MQSEPQHTSTQLDEASVDLFSEWLDEQLTQFNVERRERLRSRLLFEDILLTLRDHFGDNQAVEASVIQGPLSRLRIRVTLRGERFNPLGGSDEEDESADWSATASVGLHPQFAYTMGANVLSLTLPSKPLNPVFKFCIAIALGAGMGLLGNLLIPFQAQGVITNVVLNPLYDVWLRVLGAISSPIILFTATVTTLNTQRIDDAGGSRLALVVRYFVLMALVVAIAVGFCAVFLPLDMVWTKASAELVRGILEDVLGVVPNNLVDPFASANTPQLLLVGFVLGNVLIRLGNQGKTLRLIIRQVDAVGLALAESTSLLVPFFLGTFLCLEIWQHHYQLLANLWKPMVLSVNVSLTCLVGAVLICAYVVRVSPLTLARRLWDPFVHVLRRGSLMASLDELVDACHDWLGVNRRYAEAAAPQGLNLLMPMSAVGIYVFLVYVAEQQHIQVDQMWIVRGAVMSVVLFVATPPVAGANLLAYVVFFTDLGISGTALMDAMIFDVLFGVFANAANLVMLLIEIIVQAHRAGFLNEQILRDS